MPRKVFTAGEILTAADVNTNLMDQAVMVFAGTAARGSAIPSPSEGMVTYREDDDTVEVYNGSVWNAVGPGKILQVVRATDGTARSTSSTSYTDVTGMSVTITPTKSDSTIIIAALFSASHANNIYFFQITDSSDNPISGFEGPELGTSGVVTRPYIHGWAYASPATTSAVTYKLRFKTSGGTVNVRNDLATGQMYAIEVSA